MVTITANFLGISQSIQTCYPQSYPLPLAAGKCDSAYLERLSRDQRFPSMPLRASTSACEACSEGHRGAYCRQAPPNFGDPHDERLMDSLLKLIELEALAMRYASR